jgi:hypothetical protein
MMPKKRATLVQELLRSKEPSLRWKARVRVLEEPRGSAKVRALEEQVRRSARATALLGPSRRPYRPGTARNVYYHWQGLQWVLASLADLGYPPGDPSLGPLRDRVLELWMRPSYRAQFVASTASASHRGFGVPLIEGRARRCASQQGNALYFLTELGLDDGRLGTLASWLRGWQWPDGGWNCDRRPEADSSSFMETLTPMLGLQAHAEASGDQEARRAARRASEVFLSRQLYLRRSDGTPMDPHFTRLHYPLYWHYDILGGLKAMARLGRLSDPRCRRALDLLESLELPSGGWPATEKYYRQVSRQFRATCESVDWGPIGSRHANPWVTADALYVLRSAGRLAI